MSAASAAILVSHHNHVIGLDAASVALAERVLRAAPLDEPVVQLLALRRVTAISSIAGVETARDELETLMPRLGPVAAQKARIRALYLRTDRNDPALLEDAWAEQEAATDRIARCGALWVWLNAAGTRDVPLGRRMEVCEEFRALAEETGNEVLILQALNVAFSLHRRGGDYDGAEAALVRAIELAHQFDRPIREAGLNLNLNLIRFSRGDLDGARRALEQAQRIATRHGNLNLTGYTALAHVAMFGAERDFERVRAELDRAREAFTTLGRPTRVAGVWASQAEFALVQGDSAEARSCAGRALTLGSEDYEVRARVALILAAAELTDGDAAAAYAQVGRGLASSAQCGRFLEVPLKALGAVALARLGRFGEAVAACDEVSGIPNPAGLEWALALTSLVDVERGDPLPAKRALEAPLEAEPLAMWAYDMLRAVALHDSAGT